MKIKKTLTKDFLNQPFFGLVGQIKRLLKENYNSFMWFFIFLLPMTDPTFMSPSSISHTISAT
jgi:hypothetical protein